ncbi:DMT family transporter [Candidatus Sumerlaeota bacterium]|nr:DMT family transporter [Candidatus Sumerlaeota bacterium]
MKAVSAIGLALLAAVFYASSTPFSKVLLSHIEPTMLASFLYFGAGIGIAIVYLFVPHRFKQNENKLSKKDLPYVLGMILLDITAPILLMFGLSKAPAAHVSLLNNSEIVATSIIALIVFKETISRKLWIAITLITLSSALLSFQNLSCLQFSFGSIFVILACICWGFENNCTRKISDKNTYKIVILKGIFSGLGSFIVALIIGETIPSNTWFLLALILGFVAYGLSIFVYIRAQKELGAVKTSAYYAVAPFIGAILSLAVLREPLTVTFVVALLIMFVGTTLVVLDTLLTHHSHLHTHTIKHTHDGTTHTHTFTHDHIGNGMEHHHSHNGTELC